MIVKASPFQSVVHSIHIYPFVAVVEKRSAPIAEFVAPKARHPMATISAVHRRVSVAVTWNAGSRCLASNRSPIPCDAARPLAAVLPRAAPDEVPLRSLLIR